MSISVDRIELGVVANKVGMFRYRFDIFKRTVITTQHDNSDIEYTTYNSHWVKIRTDMVDNDNIMSYTLKCKNGSIIDINDNIL